MVSLRNCTYVVAFPRFGDEMPFVISTHARWLNDYTQEDRERIAKAASEDDYSLTTLDADYNSGPVDMKELVIQYDKYLWAKMREGVS